MKQQTTEYAIGDLARHAGISARTLRHYDAIGLLCPAHTTAGGHRYYGTDEMLRLQQIVLLKSLGLGLPAIAQIIEGVTDTATALRVHRRWLDAERRRLARMSRTLEQTLKALELGEEMTPKDLYKGFDANPYEEEARTLWGDAAVEDSLRRLAISGTNGQQELMSEHADIADELAACLTSGLGAGDARTQAAVARHHAWVSRSWTPGREAYIGLGEIYVSDERFTATYDAPKERPARNGLAAYLCSAMAFYARENLV